MRIVPYDGNEEIEDLETLSLLIKAVPFEDGYVPVFVLVAPDDNHFITIEEANCLMDGLEIANDKIDNLIAMMLQSKIAERLGIDTDDDDVEIELYDQDQEEDDEDDNGEID
jgi:hypothetical protein